MLKNNKNVITLKWRTAHFENSLMTYLACFQQNARKTTQRCLLLHHQKITQNNVYHAVNDVTNKPVYSRLKQDYIKFYLQATLGL